MTETPVTVPIIDVVEGAIEIYADALLVSDQLFDAHGGTYPLRRVEDRQPKTGRYFKTVRHDGWVDHWMPDDIVTVLPAEGTEGRGIDRSSSGSIQGYIETGRYSTVDEERAINPLSHQCRDCALSGVGVCEEHL